MLRHPHPLEGSDHIGHAAMLIREKLFDDMENLRTPPRLHARDVGEVQHVPLAGVEGVRMRLLDVVAKGLALAIDLDPAPQIGGVALPVRVTETRGIDHLETRLERSPARLVPFRGEQPFAGHDEPGDAEPDHAGEGVHACGVEIAGVRVGDQLEPLFDDLLRLVGPFLRRAGDRLPRDLGVQLVVRTDDGIHVRLHRTTGIAIIDDHILGAGVRRLLDRVDRAIRRHGSDVPVHGLPAGALRPFDPAEGVFDRAIAATVNLDVGSTSLGLPELKGCLSAH